MWNRAEKVYCVLALIYFSGAFITMGLGDTATSQSMPEWSLPFFILQVSAYIPMVFFLLMRFDRSARLILPQLWLSAFLLWVLASAAWSVDPLVTIKRAVVVCVASLFGIYFGNQFTRREQVTIVALALGITAVSTVLCGVLLPQHAIAADATSGGAWKGVFEHKNALGKFMVLMCACCMWLWSSKQAKRPILLALFIVGTALLLLSRSATSILTLILLLLLFPLFSVARRLPSAFLPAALAISVCFPAIAVFLVNNNTATLGLLVRDPTLTGRIPMWSIAFKSISMRPWLGYGFEAFWNGLQGPSAAIWEAVGWHPNQAHNGFLQIWLDLGLIGVILFCLVLYSACSRAILEFRQDTRHESLWPLLVLSCFLLLNLTKLTPRWHFDFSGFLSWQTHSLPGPQPSQRSTEKAPSRSWTLHCSARSTLGEIFKSASAEVPTTLSA